MRQEQNTAPNTGNRESAIVILSSFSSCIECFKNKINEQTLICVKWTHTETHSNYSPMPKITANDHWTKLNKLIAIFELGKTWISSL